MTFRRYIYVDLGWRHQYCGLFSLERDGVTWYFVDNEHYFCRGTLYGEFDDGERFAFFCKAVIDLLPSLDWMPDILHCNDWQTALVPIYLKDVCTRWEAVRRIRTVFTIHNIEYQGRYGEDTVDQLFGLDRGWYNDGTLQMDGDVNLMKGAMLVSDAVTTVSPTYAAQLHDAAYAEGMESVVRMIDWKFSGVVNGLDVVGYDLSQMIAMRYGAVPIVRRTGGLADTVKSCQVGQEDGTGYLFESYDAGAMLDVIGQATGLYRGDRKGFDTVRRRGMTADFSWARSAGEYRRIYGNLLG